MHLDFLSQIFFFLPAGPIPLPSLALLRSLASHNGNEIPSGFSSVTGCWPHVFSFVMIQMLPPLFEATPLHPLSILWHVWCLVSLKIQWLSCQFFFFFFTFSPNHHHMVIKIPSYFFWVSYHKPVYLRQSEGSCVFLRGICGMKTNEGLYCV